MRLSLIGLLLAAMASTIRPVAASVVRTVIGDLTGDGKPETVLLDTAQGASSTSATMSIVSGTKTIFEIPGFPRLTAEGMRPRPGFSGDTADSYKIVGKKVVVWTGDWLEEGSKWKPHYYDFTWYEWDRKLKKMVIVREGFTKKAYSYDKAKTEMPKMARDQHGLTLSKGVTFAEDAGKAASAKLGKAVVKVVYLEEGHRDQLARMFWVTLKADKRADVFIERSGKIIAEESLG